MAVAAPQIYETEFEGLLTTHLFNTNLHLRLHPTTGVAMMSHEVDLVTGTSREPGDFAQRMNRNFLEDHVFLVRSEVVDRSFIDPDAAFTPEYVAVRRLGCRGGNCPTGLAGDAPGTLWVAPGRAGDVPERSGTRRGLSLIHI